jgi:hypothetical protein
MPQAYPFRLGITFVNAKKFQPAIPDGGVVTHPLRLQRRLVGVDGQPELQMPHPLAIGLSTFWVGRS